MSRLADAKTNLFPLEIDQALAQQVIMYMVQCSNGLEQQESIRALRALMLQVGEERADQIGAELILDYPQSKRCPISTFYSLIRLDDVLLNRPFTYQFKQKQRPCKGTVLIKQARQGLTTPEAIRFINLIIHSTMDQLDCIRIKQSFFQLSTLSKTHSAFEGKDFTIGWLQGFKISAAFVANKLNLQILPVNTRFQCKTVSEFLREGIGQERFLKSMTVMTLHNGIQYKIDKIDRQTTVNSKMCNSADTYLSHFLQKEKEINEIYYNALGIQNILARLASDNYMLHVLPIDKIKRGRIRKGCYLPPGLCVITTDPNNSPAFSLSREVRQANSISTLDTYQRARKMLQFVQSNANVQEVFQQYKMRIQDEQQQYDVKVAEPPRMLVNNGQVIENGEIRGHIQRFNAAQSLIYRSQAGELTGGLMKWAIVGGNPEVNDRLAQELENRLRSMCAVQAEYNEVARPVVIDIRIDPYERYPERYFDNYHEGMHQAYSKMHADGSNEVQCIICVLPGRNKQQCAELYRQIKKDACMRRIVTQCVLEASIRRTEILGGLAEQIYAKAGGSVWEPQTDKYFQNTMICGMDISRPQKQQHSAEISLGFVSSYYGFEHFYSQARRVHRDFQAGEVQRGREVADYLEQALRQYYYFKNAKIMPQRIVFYRDGVADGQLRDLTTGECSAALQAVGQCCKNAGLEIEFIYIVAQKSPGLRICGTQVEPGSYLVENDNGFYLASQQVDSGVTPKPVRYYVLKDVVVSASGIVDKQPELEKLINFTNSLSYGYVNWCSPIETPHVLHLAHHLSKFTNEILEGQENVDESRLMDLCMRPYFI